MIKNWTRHFMQMLLGSYIAALTISVFNNEQNWGAMLFPIVCGYSLMVLVLSFVPSRVYKNSLFAALAISIYPFIASVSNSFGIALTSAIIVFGLGTKIKLKIRTRRLIVVNILILLISIFGGITEYQTIKVTQSKSILVSGEMPDKSGLPQPKGPDIILLSLDTLRSDAIVGPRFPKYELPFFDRMKNEGHWWDYGYSSSNQTLPGHASMLSGTDALASGVRYNFNQLPEKTRLPFVSEYLQEKGYQTAGVISNALIAGDMGFSRGFDLYDDSTTPRFGPRTACLNTLQKNTWLGLIPGKITTSLLSNTIFAPLRKPARSLKPFGIKQRGAITTEQASTVLGELYQSTRPYFFFLHYIDVHHPYGSPAPHEGKLTSDFPELKGEHKGEEKLGNMIAMPQLQYVQGQLNNELKKIQQEGKDVAQHYKQIYLENLLYLDSELEKIRKIVVDSGRPTLWIITSDHGEHFAENNAMLHGNHMFQDSIRVPFILSGPLISKNIRRKGIPDLADIAPTILEYAGIDVPQTMTGRSLLGENDLAEKLHVVCDDARLMLRMGNFKLIANRTESSFQPTAIYNLAIDPKENENLLGKDPIENKLIEVLENELLRDTFSESKGPRSAEQEAALNALGYVEMHGGH